VLRGVAGCVIYYFFMRISWQWGRGASQRLYRKDVSRYCERGRAALALRQSGARRRAVRRQTMNAIGLGRRCLSQAVGLALAAACFSGCTGFTVSGARAQTPAASRVAPASDAAGASRKNWYNDPFFALSSAIRACPLPLGPLMTKTEADDDAHYRVERGTTCWLAHKCSKPNSYLYDPDIATAIRQQMQGDAMFTGTSVWITVQRRFVYAEGCVPAGFDSAALERRLAAIADVEQVFVRVTSDPHGALPYKALPAAP
jgi:hypothetical protein